MNVLMVAYACEPGFGSERGAGWAWARAAAQEHTVHLITRRKYQASIEAALACEPELELRPIYVDLPPRVRRLKPSGKARQIFYVVWQYYVYRVARDVLKQHEIDIAHHVTFAVDWLPAAAVMLRAVPTIWGPVGGYTPPAWSMWRDLGMRGLGSELVRETAVRGLRRLIGDATAQRADVVVAQNSAVAERFAWHSHVVVEPNIALEGDIGPGKEQGLSREGHVAVFAGRLIPWKGLRLAVRALAEPEASDWRLHVYGVGPEFRRVVRLVRRLGLEGRVEFHGRVSHGEMLRALEQSDALIHPSLHDSAGWAVAEAAAARCAVVCLDVGGPADIVTCPMLRVTPNRDAHVGIARALAGLAAAGSSPGEDAWHDARPLRASRLPGVVNRLYFAVSSIAATPVRSAHADN